MSRSRSHQLEAESRTAFEAAIGSLWIVRHQTVDYGIDCEVEVVDEGGDLHGQLIKVQLRATDSPADPPSLRVGADHFKYWRNLDLPVLIVRYRTTDHALWWCWAHYPELHLRSGGASRTIKMPYLWNDTSRDQIQTDVSRWRARRRGHLAWPIDLLFAPHPALSTDQRMAAREFLSQAIDSVGSVRLTDNDDPQVAAVAEVGPDTIRVVLPIGVSNSIEGALDEPARGFDMVLMLGDCLYREGVLPEGAVRLMAAAAPNGRLAFAAPAFAFFVGQTLAREGHFDALRALASMAEITGAPAMLAYKAALMQADDGPDIAELADQARAYLVKGETLKAAVATNQIGRLHLAAHRYEEARAQFDEAANLRSDYRDRGDWWRERAATWACTGQYDEALADYSEAVRIGDRQSLGPLADVLLRLGRYKAAADKLEDVITDPGLTLARWRLLQLAAVNAVVFGIDEQSRQTEEVLRLADHPDDRSIAELIALDAVCPELWWRFAESRATMDEAVLPLLILVGIDPDDDFARAAALHAMLSLPESLRNDWVLDRAADVAADSNPAVETALRNFAGSDADVIMRRYRQLPSVDEPNNRLDHKIARILEPGSVRILIEERFSPQLPPRPRL